MTWRITSGTPRPLLRLAALAALATLAAGSLIAIVAVVFVLRRPERAPLVRTEAPLGTETPLGANTENMGASMRPGSNRYTKTAFWDIRAAMQKSAAALKAGKPDEAAAALSDTTLERSTGAIVERYVGARVEGQSASISSPDAAKLSARLFDLTYAIGQPGQRGVRHGEVLLLNEQGAPLALFARADDARAYGTMRVLSLMEAWTRVWQDVAGVQPISELTRRYLASPGTSRAAWSDADVLAVFHDLGVPLPPGIMDDPRFPGWRAFETWLEAEADAKLAAHPAP